MGADRLRNGFTGAVLLAVIGLAIFLAVRLPTAENVETHVVTGVVRCASGAAVQGVWVSEAARDSGGWAGWSPLSSRGDAVSYTYRLRGERFAVNVGCGGTPENWAHSVQSEYVGTQNQNFVCFDLLEKGSSMRCLPE